MTEPAAMSIHTARMSPLKPSTVPFKLPLLCVPTPLSPRLDLYYRVEAQTPNGRKHQAFLAATCK